VRIAAYLKKGKAGGEGGDGGESGEGEEGEEGEDSDRTVTDTEAGACLHSFTLELNLSNSRTHSWVKLGYTVDR
jgi:hypothetical protein